MEILSHYERDSFKRDRKTLTLGAIHQKGLDINFHGRWIAIIRATVLRPISSLTSTEIFRCRYV